MTVIISAQDLDTHSSDNTELKEKFEKAVVQMWAVVNMLYDWRKGMDDKYLKRIKNIQKKCLKILSVGFRKCR